MGRTSLLTLTSLLFLAADASGQVPFLPRRAPLTPAETRPAIGVLAGPTSRAAGSHTEGLELAIAGEKPIDTGWRARGEIGAALWTDYTLTRVTAGIYRVHGRSPVHSFIGAGGGLYRHETSGADASGFRGGAHVGMGMEYEGGRHGLSTEVRVGLAPSPDNYGAVLNLSLLVGVKRVF